MTPKDIQLLYGLATKKYQNLYSNTEIKAIARDNHINDNSAIRYCQFYAKLVKGEVWKSRATVATAEYFIDKIFKTADSTTKENVIRALKLYIEYNINTNHPVPAYELMLKKYSNLQS